MAPTALIPWLDPANLVIDATSGDETLPGTAAGDFTVKAVAINRQLVAGTSVTLQADNDITLNVGAVIDGRASSGGVAGGGLTLQATRDIVLNGLVILNDAAVNATAGRRANLQRLPAWRRSPPPACGRCR